MKIGHEQLPLNTWVKLCQYNVFRELLGTGLTSHLQQNDLLRDIFQMGPAPLHYVESKATRLERVSPCYQCAITFSLCLIVCRNM